MTLPADIVRRQHSAQLPRYLLVGALATLSHYGVFLLALELTTQLTASLLGAALGTAISYQGNRRWTFARRNQATRPWQLLRFCLTALAYNLGNALLMLVLLNQWPGSPLFMQMLSTASLTLMTYWINRTWTFKNEVA
ncbi:GtrA family protein [Pseudomonas chlororaphis]|uniref:GtrA family protein n=1 Tax=Pseudomonas chlororaphis TaxID=587753 RepID=A0AAX3FMP8_9PSED|nr:GtrA family protein [Pseudomonas chlororaphis]AZC37504.1 GtrA family protein [Pseudomonas chlororaphis subsp. piscium]AZC44053.1 GtrA family protein [Pseudomonas chlororaphis subsp. piscium]AZC50708.1 GtrA family protein [Pseudomonas chlororaphis subsp. piscium]AZC75917.1 GtrA family protein [Pseudomonas chlororaphis subsp. piscium]WDG75898.1 GtrA family protein [Pseudomonas chlororaphis]